MDLEQRSIERIKLAALMSEQYYNSPLICTYSAGQGGVKKFGNRFNRRR